MPLIPPAAIPVAAIAMACLAGPGSPAGFSAFAAPDAPRPAGTSADFRRDVEAAWQVQDAQRLAVRASGITTRTDAAGAVDGVKHGRFAFHTDIEDHPWWQVDLGEVRPLARALVYNRCDGHGDRVARLEVLLSEDGREWKKVYAHDGSLFGGISDGKPLAVTLGGARARFLRIRLAERNWLHFDEVEVYGEADPEVNLARGKPCDQSSTSEWSTAKAAAASPQDIAFPFAEAIVRGRRLMAERRAASEGCISGCCGAGGWVGDAVALEALAAKVAALGPAPDSAAARDLYLGIRWAVRKLVFSDPLLAFDRLLFVKRLTYNSSHIYTDHYDGSGRMGGNLCILSPVAPDGRVTEVAPQLAGGLFGRFDLSPDAKRIVFAYKRPGTGFRIHEIGVDGSDLRQLTLDEPDEKRMCDLYGHGFDDMDPCYLPSGEIAFVSTRSRRAVLCVNNFTSTALHVMDSGGGRIRCLSGNTVNEFTPSVAEDGRILYTRWEYIDKGCGDVQSLWSMLPDGSHSAHVFKNNVRRPATLIDARSIPGTHLLVAIGAPHMPLSVGPVVTIDTTANRLVSSSMTNLTPEIEYPGHNGYPSPDRGFYKECFPLSEKLFLVAYNAGPDPFAPAGYGLYLLDGAGNRELLYRDPDFSCFQPIPLVPRKRPPDVPAVRNVPGDPRATLLLADVYCGLTGIARGTVKYLRVMEDVPKPWAASWAAPQNGDVLGLQNPAVSLKGHFAIKEVHGIVPVEDDGSALFTVPSEKNVYFQALDGDFMEIQRMRTFVNLMPGEVRSCIGCHEPREAAPPGRTVLALRHPPRRPSPQSGESGPRTVHYPIDVQPIFERHCTRCHGGAEPKGELDLTGELTVLFCRSYESLILKGLINHIDVDPRDAFIPAEPPLTFGSHRSRLIEKLRAGHQDVRLDREEFIRLVTWIDSNAPYYGTYEGKRNIRWKGDPDFRPDPAPGPAEPQVRR